jgi:hypothetical protein
MQRVRRRYGLSTLEGKGGMAGNKLVGVYGVIILVALWLIVSPFVLGYAAIPAALWNSFAVGVIVIAIAAVRAFVPESPSWLSWVSVVFGLWLIIAPFILAFGGLNLQHWNTTLTGIVLASVSAWSALTPTAEA